MLLRIKLAACVVLAIGARSVLLGQEAGHVEFGQRLECVVTGTCDSASVDDLGWITAIQFDQPGWEYFNEYEKKRLTDEAVALSAFRPIQKEDIVALRPDHAVVLLHARQGPAIRLASIARNGVPIQSFLLRDHYGYLYEKNWRSFSFTEAVHYNPTLQGFEFFQLTYGYEPIPTREHPTQDPIYHQSYHLVTVDESGHILLARSEPTGDRMFNREPSRFVQHEVAFQAFSLFTVHDDAVPRDAIWEERFLTPGDMDAHDSLVIQLDFEANWSGRFFFIEPADGYSIVEVAQRHENILTFPGDGTTCSLENWNRYASTWKDLHCTEHFFQTVSLNANEKGRFHAFEQGELLAAFEAECGAYNPEDDHSLIAVPSPYSPLVVVDCIVLRVRFESPSGGGENVITLKLASGC